MTASNFHRLEALFGPNGACGGCWCMTPRLARKNYEKNKGEKNRRALLALAKKGPPPGLIALAGDEPVGWISIEPRERFEALARSRILKPVDERPMWSIVCMYVKKGLRGQGLSRKLIEAAVAHARASGATTVEAYPVEPKQDRMPDVFAWTGIASAYRAAGFEEVARRSATRPIMRRRVSGRGAGQKRTRSNS